MLLTILFGALLNTILIWDMADVAKGIMALLNLIAILLLSRVACLVINDHDAQRRAGQAPTFTRDRIPELTDGIEGDVWKRGDGHGTLPDTPSGMIAFL